MKSSKKHFIFSFFAFLCLLLIAACDWDTDDRTGNYQRFDWDIQGTWKTNESESRYTGTLVIDYNRITITGYGETQTPAQGGNDTERPFRNITKNTPLEGYTEEQEATGQKIILIKDAGTWQEAIPYIYWYDYPPTDFEKVEFLRFTFGNRQETLRKQ